MFIDIVNAGWVRSTTSTCPGPVRVHRRPSHRAGLPVDPLHLRAPRPARHPDDVTVHQQYIADIEASAREALATVDPIPFYMRYGENAWAGVKANLDTVTERAAAPSSPSTPVCWPLRTSRSSPTRRHSRSCSRCASTPGSASRAGQPLTRMPQGRRRPGAVPRPEGADSSYRRIPPDYRRLEGRNS